MRFFKRHWFKLLILLPFIPVGILIHSLDRFTGIDESLRFLVAFVLIAACLFVFCLGFYFELNKGNVENKKIRLKIGNFKFGLAEISRLMLTVAIIIFSYVAFDYATMSVRAGNILDDVAAPTDALTERTYSFVVMSDFDNSARSYGRVGVLAMEDEARDLATEAFLYEQNYLPNPVLTTLDSPIDLITALYNGEVDAIIIGSNFGQIFDELERFEYIEEETRVLDQFIVETEGVERVDIDPGEPFSILLLGLNQNDEALTSGTINTFMLLTINLEQLSITAVSIPRDSFVLNPCWGNYDKLSHTNSGGTACAVGAIEQLFDMEIPYYVKLNFTGFMEIIDILGGIEVDVPMAFSEQDSERRLGSRTIYVEEGLQTLNAEQALALVRHRNLRGTSNMIGDDFARVANQQLVFQAMLREMFNEVNGINDILPLLEVIGRHLETNLTAHEITTILQYIIGLLGGRETANLMDDIHFINTVILGNTGDIDIGYGFMSVVHPFPEMIAEARRLMMINLGLEDPEFSFTFEFDGFDRPSRQWAQTNETHGSSGFYPPPPPYEPNLNLEAPPTQEAPIIQQPPPPSESNSNSEGSPPPSESNSNSEGSPPPSESNSNSEGSPPSSESNSNSEGSPPSSESNSNSEGSPPPPSEPDPTTDLD